MALTFNNYMQTVMNTVLDGLIVIDKLGYIQIFNQSAQSIFGYEQEEVLGQNVKLLMPDPYRSEHDGYLAHHNQTGATNIIGIGREIKAQRKDGTIFPMELGVNAMEVEGKKYFVGTIRDISERKRAEEEIQSYIKKLKISNEELDQFAYIASHDLKEPLRGLANNALFLQEDYAKKLDEGADKRLERMRFLCTRMEQLVDNLLYYSRLGRHELAVTFVDLNDVVKKVQELSVADDIGLTGNIIVPDVLPEVLCDKIKITELFRNLISNSLKYNDKQHKTVEVGVTSRLNPISQKQEQRVFYVKDNGIGIEKQYFDEVFKIFRRLNFESDTERGSGVGLTFVKKIIERHDGHVWLESTLGKGTTFYFTLNMGTSGE